MNHKPFIIVVSAPSGAGKTTILKEVRRLVSGVFYSVSATTRPPDQAKLMGLIIFSLQRKSSKE